MLSHGDKELYIRWLQLGCFSPINRMHSANDKWSKEPWLYGKEAENIVTRFLRLRHRLLPYIYTCNVKTATKGIPIVMPMYYKHDCKEAYEFKRQFYFGESMIVAPVVEKKNKEGLSPVSVWLPEGKWYDFFTNEIFEGNQVYDLLVPMDRIPVFVKAGSIIPMLADASSNDQSFTSLEVVGYAGCEGKYRMYDDVGYIDFKLKEDEEDGYVITSRKYKGVVTENIETTIIM